MERNQTREDREEIKEHFPSTTTLPEKQRNKTKGYLTSTEGFYGLSDNVCWGEETGTVV